MQVISVVNKWGTLLLINNEYSYLNDTEKAFDGSLDLLSSYLFFLEERLFDKDVHKILEEGYRKIDTIDVLRNEELTYDTFVKCYMETNTPCIINGLTSNWTVNDWLEEGSIEISNIPTEVIESVSDVHTQKMWDFNVVSKSEINVAEYFKWWINYHENKDNKSLKVEDFNGIDLSYILYLKDWTFQRLFPDINIYECPIYFQDDWMNEYLDQKYKFIYLGVEGTSTKLHCDVLSSYSWSSNICGVKRWHLLPPQYTYLLYDSFGQKIAPHFDADEEIYPGLLIARNFLIEAIQYPGQTIFVPSNWHHTVVNMKDTLSLNHNWINGFNVKYVWDRVKRDLIIYQNLNDDFMLPSHEADITDLWIMLTAKAQKILINDKDDALNIYIDVILLISEIIFEIINLEFINCNLNYIKLEGEELLMKLKLMQIKCNNNDKNVSYV